METKYYNTLKNRYKRNASVTTNAEIPIIGKVYIDVSAYAITDYQNSRHNEKTKFARKRDC